MDSSQNMRSVLQVLIGVFAVLAVYVVPALITWWTLYTKAGRPGWAPFVPVYRQMVMADIGGRPMWQGVVAGLFSLSGLLPIPIVNPLSHIVSPVLEISLAVALAKKYDRGFGFWVLVYLVPLGAAFLVNSAKFTGEVPSDRARRA